MYKVKKFIISLVCIVIVVVSLFLINVNETYIIYPKKEYSQVLTLWQIDTFSGGKGSRTSFIRSIANSFSKIHPEILFLVTNHTVESASKSINEGKIPDLISYGASGFTFIEKFIKLKNYDIIDGDYNNKFRYAVSWCKGGYFALKKGNGEKVIIQDIDGGNIFLALINQEIKIENYEIHNEEYAYSLFLRSQNATLYGNQRNIVRLQNANIEFESAPLTSYNDMYQYISILTNDGQKIAYCNTFIDYLLSDEIQKKLVEISMFSTKNLKLYNDNEHFSAFENISVKYTISPFLEKERIEDIKIRSKTSFLTQEYDKDLVNYLK